MTHVFHGRACARRAVRAGMLAAALVVAGACGRNNQPDTDPDPRFDPIPIHVRNDNFLDVNVAVISGGVSRRLGLVTGNSAGDFTVPWSVGNGSGIVLMATPIGSRGSVTLPAVNVGVGQVVDLRIASVIRQSVVSVHEP
jgi:hypothetical protein